MNEIAPKPSLYESGPSVGESSASSERRFGGIARLYGAKACARFAVARVAVVGIGGVGSWAAEALARSGVRRLTLIDLDHVAESNTNRQIHAIEGEYGKPKVQAMAERIGAIDPSAETIAVEAFLDADNAEALLRDLEWVVDCTDAVRAKAALVACARDRGIGVVSCGAAGGRRDPLRLRVADLSAVAGDPLLASLRHRLRREYGFPAAALRGRAARFGVAAVYSDEPVQYSAAGCAPGGAQPGSPLACGGYGSVATVTAAMGLAAAAQVLEGIAAQAVRAASHAESTTVAAAPESGPESEP